MSDTTSTTPSKTSTSDSGSTSSDSSSSSGDSSSGDSTSPSDSGTSSKSSGGGGGGARPISYFSSVSTDEYRSGWDNIFSGAGDTTAQEPARRRPAARKPKEPLTIELSLEDLGAELRAGLEAAARAKAKSKRVSYDKRVAAGTVAWRLTCEIRR